MYEHLARTAEFEDGGGCLHPGMQWFLETRNDPPFTTNKKTRPRSYKHKDLNSANNLNKQEAESPMEPPESNSALLTP